MAISNRILTLMLLISPCFKLLDRCIILCIIAHGFPPIVCKSYWRRNLPERWLSTILKVLSSTYATLSSLSPQNKKRLRPPSSPAVTSLLINLNGTSRETLPKEGKFAVTSSRLNERDGLRRESLSWSYERSNPVTERNCSPFWKPA